MLCPHHSCINRRPQTVNVTFQAKNKWTTSYLSIGFTELKIYGKDKW
ncbi:hypothetical protein [Candidatus Enterovibrio altilux]